jgi:cytochrome c oxidase accessory protein FixG
MAIENIDLEGFRDHLSNTSQIGKRLWIYPRIIVGKLYKLRTVFSWVLLAALFGLPLIEVEGHPLFLFNVLERHFIFFGVIFFPQDFYLVAIGLLTFLVFIILFTVVFGRVFCGWVCPQTIFLEMVFRKIENWIEGDFKAQKRLDEAPWTFNKIFKKVLKHKIFFIISFVIANTFLMYIIGKRELLNIILDNPLNHLGGLAAILIFTFLFYVVFAHVREIVCIVACPYGRLQGVLLDKKSIIVAYDNLRGDPRGKLQKHLPLNITDEKVAVHGDCIDCHLCVQVCPTGIDIRNGTQLECVNCTACIDACDMVMDKIQKPRGLIRYDSLEGIEKKEKLKLNPRIIGYSLVLMALLGIFGYLMMIRTEVEATILRTPGLMFQKNEDGTISNLYNIEIVNKTYQDKAFTLKINYPKATIKLMGKPLTTTKGEMAKGSFFINIPKNLIQQNNTKIEIEILSNNQVVDKVKTSFMGPVQ